MFQLILTILSIALVSATALASVNYLPWWQKPADSAAALFTRAFEKLEPAFNVAAQANMGANPTPTSDVDGGFLANFRSAFKVLPPALPGYQWVYGVQGPNAGAWSGLAYFCMAPSGKTMAMPAYRGLTRAAFPYSQQQLVINTGCGATQTVSFPETTFPAPVAITFYVAYVPPISP